MTTTIKDVARVAGVSPATVSRVLNNSPRVKKETEIKVKKAINELNYEINEPARTLRTATSNLIGVIGVNLNNKFLMDMLEKAEIFARKEGYNFLLGDSGKSLDKKIDYLQIMKQKNIDGIIIISSSWQENFLEKLEKSQIPAVIASGQMPNSSITCVSVNNRLAGFQVIEKLYQMGHDKIGIITGPKTDTISSQKRLQGVLDASEEFGLNIRENLIATGDFTFNSGFVGAQKLIRNNEGLSAIFAFDDRMAIGAIRGVESQKKSVPDDVSVMGFDNIEVAKFVSPSLSTVHQPCASLGKTAIELLLKKIEEENFSATNKFIDHEIVLRESTAPNNNLY